MKSVPLLLRDRLDDLLPRWSEALDGQVGADYRDLVAGPVGEHLLRGVVGDLIECADAERYEIPALMRAIEERTTAEARSRLTLGFSLLDMIVALHLLRAVIADVLVDAHGGGEEPPFAECLLQFREVNAFLDRLVCAIVAAG